MPTIPERVLTEGASSYRVRIRIQMSQSGIASSPQFVTRSGNLEIDSLALQAATAMRYTPEYIDCEPIAGPYDLQFYFDLHPRSGESGSQSSFNQVTILAPPCPGDRGPILLSAPPIPAVGVARGRSLSAIAIDLYVERTGSVASARVVHSSGDKAVDREIASVAARAGFQPAIHACRQAAGVYTFRANFHTKSAASKPASHHP